MNHNDKTKMLEAAGYRFVFTQNFWNYKSGHHSTGTVGEWRSFLPHEADTVLNTVYRIYIQAKELEQLGVAV